jgi:hypothetical protein
MDFSAGITWFPELLDVVANLDFLRNCWGAAELAKVVVPQERMRASHDPSSKREGTF